MVIPILHRTIELDIQLKGDTKREKKVWINNCLIVLFAEREDKRWGGYQRTRSLNTGKFDLQGEKKYRVLL